MEIKPIFHQYPFNKSIRIEKCTEAGETWDANVYNCKYDPTPMYPKKQDFLC